MYFIHQEHGPIAVADLAQTFQETARRHHIATLANEAGLVLTKCGPNTIRIAPPLVLTEEQADAGVDIILSALRKLQW